MKNDERVELTASEAKDAIAALTGLTKLVLDLRTSCRSAHRQVEMFMRDGERERLTVALVELESALSKDVNASGLVSGTSPPHRLAPDNRGQGMRVCVDCGRTEPTDDQHCGQWQFNARTTGVSKPETVGLEPSSEPSLSERLRKGMGQ